MSAAKRASAQRARRSRDGATSATRASAERASLAEVPTLVVARARALCVCRAHRVLGNYRPASVADLQSCWCVVRGRVASILLECTIAHRPPSPPQIDSDAAQAEGTPVRALQVPPENLRPQHREKGRGDGGGARRGARGVRQGVAGAGGPGEGQRVRRHVQVDGRRRRRAPARADHRRRPHRGEAGGAAAREPVAREEGAVLPRVLLEDVAEAELDGGDRHVRQLEGVPAGERRPLLGAAHEQGDAAARAPGRADAVPDTQDVHTQRHRGQGRGEVPDQAAARRLAHAGGQVHLAAAPAGDLQAHDALQLLELGAPPRNSGAQFGAHFVRRNSARNSPTLLSHSARRRCTSTCSPSTSPRRARPKPTSSSSVRRRRSCRGRSR